MEISIHCTFLPHDDPDASLAFYRDILGYSGMRWITIGRPSQPGTSIVPEPPSADPRLTEDERRTISVLMAKGSYSHVTLATKDLDGLFAQLERRGAEIVQEPTDQPYGVRDCAVRDPAGNLIRFNQLT